MLCDGKWLRIRNRRTEFKSQSYLLHLNLLPLQDRLDPIVLVGNQSITEINGSHESNIDTIVQDGITQGI